MTGVLNAMVGAGGGEIISVTIADINSLGTVFGYNDSGSPSGSIAPTTYRGVTIRVISHNTSGADQFSITLTGSRAQSFIGGVQIQKTDGSIQVLHSADASFSDLTSVSSWGWAVDGIWTGTSPSPRSVRIFL